MGAKFSFSGANTSAYCLSNASTIAFSTSAIAYNRNPKRSKVELVLIRSWDGRVQNKDLWEEKKNEDPSEGERVVCSFIELNC